MFTVGPASLSFHINNEAWNAVWILGLLNEPFKAPYSYALYASSSILIQPTYEPLPL